MSARVKLIGNMRILNFYEFLNEAAENELYAVGAKGEEVKKIQQRLIALGLLKIKEPTGYYGPETEAAVKAFQKSKGLPEKDRDGMVGPTTYPMLMSASGSVSLPKNLTAQSADTTSVARDARAFRPIPSADLAKKLVGDSNAINPNASLLFTGEELQWIIGGKPVKSWPAISGITWKNTPITQWVDTLKRYTIDPAKWSKDKDAGPLPPGKYTVGPVQGRDKTLPTISQISALWSWLTGQYNEKPGGFSSESEFSRVAWGNYRAPINSAPGTDTHGRGSFYIHGGAIPGSHGCIDLTDQMDDFAKYYAAWLASTNKEQIDLTVSYKKPEENSIFSKLWGDKGLFAYDQSQSQGPAEFTA